jgi:hypothetical protein
MNECPVCGSPHDSVDGVIIHMRNMKDAEHAHIVSLEEAFTAIRQKSRDSEVTKDEVTKSEVTSEVSEGDSENRRTGVTASDFFDEPSEGAELSDFEGEPVGDMVALPCGHEELHPSDIPPDMLNVKCSVCGQKFGVGDV